MTDAKLKEISLKTVRGHASVWTNQPQEAHAGECVTLSTEKLGVWGAKTRAQAMCSLADKLERMALELRTAARNDAYIAGSLQVRS
jgi:hypothetical protein